MTKNLQNYIIEKTNEMISYDFCCPDSYETRCTIYNKVVEQI